MSHPDPILRAVPCDPKMMPKNAAALMKRAEKRNLNHRATIAFGYRTFGRADSGDYRPVRSVLVKIQSPRARLAALWVGPVDGSKMQFDGAWIYRPGTGVEKLSSEAVKLEVDAL
jgi:hypothetical protein